MQPIVKNCYIFRPLSPLVDFRPFSSISITSDVFEVDDEEVIYHEPEPEMLNKPETRVIHHKPETVMFNKPETRVINHKSEKETPILSKKTKEDFIEVAPGKHN